MRSFIMVLVAATFLFNGNLFADTKKSRKETKTRTVRMMVTGYCPYTKCCGSRAHGVTSTGDNAWVLDGVAADPRLIPYRTKLRIPGVGIQEVDDTGGRMREDAEGGIYHNIDVRFHTHKEAKRFGRKWLYVQIRRKRQMTETEKSRRCVLSIIASGEETMLQPGDRMVFSRKGEYLVTVLQRVGWGVLEIKTPGDRQSEVALRLPYSSTACDETQALSIALLIAATHGFGLEIEESCVPSAFLVRFTE